jgi:hypothetical protein
MLSGGLSMQTSTVSESIPITILTLPELHLGQKQSEQYPNFNIVGEIWMQQMWQKTVKLVL